MKNIILDEYKLSGDNFEKRDIEASETKEKIKFVEKGFANIGSAIRASELANDLFITASIATEGAKAIDVLRATLETVTVKATVGEVRQGQPRAVATDDLDWEFLEFE